MQTMGSQLTASLQSQWKLEQQRAEQTAALAHDLKTPLAIITGNADLLAEDENLTEAQKAQIAAMQRAAEKADRYLQTLRAVNTAETSPQEPMQRVQVQERLLLLALMRVSPLPQRLLWLLRPMQQLLFVQVQKTLLLLPKQQNHLIVRQIN